MSVSVTFARLCDAALDAGGSLIALAASARTEQSDVQADASSSAFPTFTIEDWSGPGRCNMPRSRRRRI